MFTSDAEAIDATVVDVRAAVGLLDAAALSLPEIKARMAAGKSVQAALDLYMGRLAKHASALWGRDGKGAAADAGGLSAGATDRLSANATRIDAQPTIEDAVLDGSLSSAQAGLIADAAEKNPDAVDRLLDVAKTSPADLRGECLNVKSHAESDAERAKRHHKNRSFRTWTGDDGQLCGRFDLPVEAGSPIAQAVRKHAAKLMRARDRAGEMEPFEAYCADAFVELITTGGVTVTTVINVVADAAAVSRGDTLDGERCEIPGVGPVSAQWVRSQFGEAGLNLILTKGKDVANVTHIGRHIPAETMTALLVGIRRCSHPGCTKTGYLERDHIIEISRGGLTNLENLQWLCPEHHRHKTRTYNRGQTKRTPRTSTPTKNAAKPKTTAQRE